MRNLPPARAHLLVAALFLSLSSAACVDAPDTDATDDFGDSGKADGTGRSLLRCQNSLVKAGQTWHYQSGPFNADSATMQLTVRRNTETFPVVTLDRISGGEAAWWAKDAAGKPRVVVRLHGTSMVVAHLSLGEGDNVAYAETSQCVASGTTPTCAASEKLVCDGQACRCVARPSCPPSTKLAEQLAPHIARGTVVPLRDGVGDQMCMGPFPLYDLSRLSVFDADLVGAGAGLGYDCTVRSDAQGRRSWDPNYCIWTVQRTAFGDPGAIALSFSVDTPQALFQIVATTASLLDAINFQSPSSREKALFGAYVTQMGTFLLQAGARDLVQRVNFSNGLSVAFIWDRFGQFYWSVAPSLGAAPGPVGIGLTAIYPAVPFNTPADARNFMAGSGWSACGGFGMVGCVLHVGPADRLDRGNWGVAVGVGWPPGVSYSWGTTQQFDYCPAQGKVWSDAQAGCI